MQAEHLNETISFPSKPEWQPIQLSIYDRCIAPYEHPIMTWLKQQYNPKPLNGNCSTWYPCIDPLSFKACAYLILVDGCGNKLEEWFIEHCYPQSIDFGELDMQSMDVVTAEVTLKYDRAYQTFPPDAHPLYTACAAQCPDPVCDQGTTGGGSGGVDTSPPKSPPPPLESPSQNPGAQSGGANGIQTGNNDSTDIPPGITSTPQGDVFYSGALDSYATPYQTPDGLILKDNATGIYWRTLPSHLPGTKLWQRWSNGTWSVGSSNPLLGGGPVLPFAAIGVRSPDFIMI
jgi:hypothetical protein